MRHRLDEIEKTISSWKPPPLDVHETDLLLLPDHLRRTYLMAVSLGQCDATQVSTHTGRCRTIESSYLNQLARTGWLAKRRVSKTFVFYPISRELLTKRNREDETPIPQPAKLSYNVENANRKDLVASKTIKVEHLSTDYDGTLSPIQIDRCESRVPLETRALLSQISRSIPISIITMKDLHFITPRTPFAHAWSATGGLETQIGKRILKSKIVDSKLPMISKALEYAKTQANVAGIEIEEKQDSEGQTIAFCVDWRRTKKLDLAKQVADRIVDYSEALGLQVIRYESQPFCDVYPISPDKGKALQEMLGEIAVRKGVMYLGDSETDNAVFKNPIVSVSIGVIHDESQLRNLECDYLLKFEDVPDFFSTLIMEKFQFSPSFPMIKINPFRRISP